MVGLYGSQSGMAGVDVTWDADTLDAFLLAPKDFVSNIMMTPMSDDKERADVIAFLETLKWSRSISKITGIEGSDLTMTSRFTIGTQKWTEKFFT